MSNYLIVYISQTGSTREIAEKLAENVISAGHTADIQDLEKDFDISGYSHIILGAPIHGMQMMPEATAFLQKNSLELKDKKLALFTVSYVTHCGRKTWGNMMKKKIDQLAESYNIAHTAHLCGRVDKQLPAPARWLFGIPRNAPLDLRNDQEVADWAQVLLAD